MSEIYKRIDELCGQFGVNVTQMCKAADVPRGAMTDLKMGRTKNLSTATLDKLSQYFGVSTDYLLGKEQKEKPTPQGGELSYDDMYLLAKFHQADESVKEAIRLLLK